MASIDENIDKFEQIEKSIEQLEGIDFLYFVFLRSWAFNVVISVEIVIVKDQTLYHTLPQKRSFLMVWLLFWYVF